jgi:chromosome segregation ATPase
MEEKMALAKEEAGQLEKERISQFEAVKAATEGLQVLKDEKKSAERELKIVQSEYDAASLKFEEERKSCAAFDATLTKIEKTKKKKTQQLSDTKLDIENSRVKFESFNKDCQSSREIVKKLESAHKWIPDKKQYGLFTIGSSGIVQNMTLAKLISRSPKRSSASCLNVTKH